MKYLNLKTNNIINLSYNNAKLSETGGLIFYIIKSITPQKKDSFTL